jgi:hypothetical protein
MQRTLNMIALQGYEEEEEQDQPVQMLIDPPPPAIQQVAVRPEQVPEQQPEQQQIPAQQQDIAMCISAAAYTGSPSDSTISLLLNFHKAQAVALADTGSTRTFMDLSFAKAHNIPLTATQERTVKVAGGGTLASGFMAYKCKFTVQGTTFMTDFRILELQGADIILGVDWFKQHNPVTFDFIGRQLTIGVQGKLLTFKDHLLPTDKLLISSDTCNKLLSQGATGYFLLYTDMDQQQDNQAEVMPVSDAIGQLLHQFRDIFELPKGLPPQREPDHTIPLLPGTKPPNIRPYRMSHSQKTTVEQIIQEMLQQRDQAQL